MTLLEAQEKLEMWQKAEVAVSKGQNYSIDGMSATRVDAVTIGRNIAKYQKIIVMINRKRNTGSTVNKAVW